MARAKARAGGEVSLPRLIDDNIEAMTDTINKLQRDAEKLQKKLIKRGRQAEREGKKQVNKLLKEFRKNGLASQIKTARRQVEKTVDGGIAQVYKVLNLPQRKDVETLSRKVSALEKQVGTLRRSRRAPARRVSQAS